MNCPADGSSNVAAELTNAVSPPLIPSLRPPAEQSSKDKDKGKEREEKKKKFKEREREEKKKKYKAVNEIKRENGEVKPPIKGWWSFLFFLPSFLLTIPPSFQPVVSHLPVGEKQL